MTDLSSTSSRSPRLGLPYLYPGQAQKEAFVNEGFARLDALVQTSVVGVVQTPPDEPDLGDCYIAADGATGDWAGHDGDLVSWAGNQWVFHAPSAGAMAFDTSRGAFIRLNAEGDWMAFSAPDPVAGGSVQDIELRAAVAAIVAQLRQFGIFT